jgi:hypothetical protein
MPLDMKSSAPEAFESAHLNLNASVKMKLPTCTCLLDFSLRSRMEKLLLAALALFALAPAHAEWFKLLENSHGVSVYVEPSKVNREASTRALTELWNYTDPDQFGDRSSKIDAEYDCEGHARRILRVTGFKAAMGEGPASAVRENPRPVWAPVKPQSMAGAIERGVCLQ